MTQEIVETVLGQASGARPVVATPYTEGAARFSPDSRWIAYQSNESGRFEVYAKPLPDGTRRPMMPLLDNEQNATRINLVIDFLQELRKRAR